MDLADPIAANPNRADLSPIELKLLNRLLEDPLRPIESLKPNSRISNRGFAELCSGLVARGWVVAEWAIARVAITRKGLFLLDRDMASRPVTPDEFLLLRSLQQKSLAPDEMAAKVPLADRPRLLTELADRGFVTITKRQLVALQLTDTGRQQITCE
jgi:hypothetical protein